MKLLKYWLSWLSADTLKKMKKLAIKIDIDCLPIKCAYQVFIIQNLDVLILELDMKICDIWKYYFNLTPKVL